MLQLLPQWRFVNTDCKNRAYYISVFTSSIFKNPAVHYITVSYIILIRDLLSPTAKPKKTEIGPWTWEASEILCTAVKRESKGRIKNKTQEFLSLLHVSALQLLNFKWQHQNFSYAEHFAEESLWTRAKSWYRESCLLSRCCSTWLNVTYKNILSDQMNHQSPHETTNAKNLQLRWDTRAISIFITQEKLLLQSTLLYQWHGNRSNPL